LCRAAVRAGRGFSPACAATAKEEIDRMAKPVKFTGSKPKSPKKKGMAYAYVQQVRAHYGLSNKRK
jgi:hypothetical protein